MFFLLILYPSALILAFVMMSVEEFRFNCSMNGHLRERPLAELIREITAAKLSGALRLTRERVQAVVYAEAGEVICARSNLRVHRLAVCLRRWGVLAEDKLSALVPEHMTDAEASESLTAGGLLTPDILSKLLVRQATDVMHPLLLWTEGEWSFEPRARFAEDVRFKLELRQSLMEAARQLPAEFVATRLSDDKEIILPVKGLPQHLHLLPLEGFVLSRVESPLRLGELLSISGLPEEQARQCIYTLALGGFLARTNWPAIPSQLSRAQSRPAGAVSTATSSAANSSIKEKGEQESGALKPQTPPDPRAEMDSLLALVYDADYFQILNVGRTADNAEIKRAYYALAKRFHPDRFQRDADASLLTQVEAAFMKITQAYETLGNPSARAAYELKLDAQPVKPNLSPASGHAESPPKPSSSSGLSREQRAAESYAQGLAALKENNLSAAVTHLGEAARLVPQQASYHAFYGNALARSLSTRHQALFELETAIKLDDNNPTYHFMLAELLRTLGQTLRAERELERAIALDPTHNAARRLLDQLRKAKHGDGNQ